MAGRIRYIKTFEEEESDKTGLAIKPPRPHSYYLDIPYQVCVCLGMMIRYAITSATNPSERYQVCPWRC